MNFQFYLEKLYESNEYKDFIKENPSGYLAGAFLSIDVENNGGVGDEQHIDYYVSGKEMHSFCISKSCQKTPINLRESDKIPQEISKNVDFDIDDIKKMIENKMEEQGIKNKMQKVLLSLQAKNNKNFLIGTVFISTLGIIKLSISLEEMKIGEFEKKSIFDLVKRVK